MGCISTTRARCGCGLSRAPTANTRLKEGTGRRLRAAFPDEALIVLWDGAPYSELHFTEVLWPDFSRADLEFALAEFDARKRRFGGR